MVSLHLESVLSPLQIVRSTAQPTRFNVAVVQSTPVIFFYTTTVATLWSDSLGPSKGLEFFAEPNENEICQYNVTEMRQREKSRIDIVLEAVDKNIWANVLG